MSTYLLDVNAMIAMFWPSHIHHGDAHRWFAKRSKGNWASCSFTQAGFVRIVSNPAFSKDAATPVEALRVLVANLRHSQHRFLADDVGFAALVEPLAGQLAGRRQVNRYVPPGARLAAQREAGNARQGRHRHAAKRQGAPGRCRTDPDRGVKRCARSLTRWPFALLRRWTRYVMPAPRA